MQRLFIFAIGGTGSRVLRSLNFLLAAGIDGLTSQTEIFPLIIDYDKQNGDKSKTLDCINNYRAVRRAFEKHPNENDEFFMTNILKIGDMVPKSKTTFELVFAPKNGQNRFKDSIDYISFNGPTASTQYLIDSLYDTSRLKERAELDLNMTIGFQGNPNIGSVVFDELQNTPEYKDFQTLFNPATDEIMIIGSLFGGTGSSGIPALINAIRSKKAPTKLQNAIVGAIMILPYFDLGAVPNGAAGSIKPKIFASKVKAALNFYEDSGLNNAFDSIYYVGDQNLSKLNYADGGVAQKNPANIVEFIAALSIVHFILNGKKGKTAYYKYGTACGLYGNNGKKVLSYDDLKNDDFTCSVLNRLNQLTLSLKYFTDVIENKKSSLSDAPFYKYIFDNVMSWTTHTNGNNPLQDLCYYLHCFYVQYRDWLAELANENNGHQLVLYDLAQPIYKMFYGKPQTKMAGFPKKEKPSVEESDLTLRIDNVFYTNHFEKGKGLKTPEEKDFVLMDILRKGSENLMKDNTKINL